MRLLDMTKSNGVYAQVETLDSLWEKASSLGKVEVDNSFRVQSACITFERSSGSYVIAKGKSPDIREAMRLAIEEALALGARP